MRTKIVLKLENRPVKRTEIKKFKKKFDDYSERKRKYEEQKSILKDRNSFSKTDHDATFMRMKEDHMKMANLSQDKTNSDKFSICFIL